MTDGPAPLTVAAVQVPSVPGDLAANAETAAASVRKAAGAGARLVVLPELFLCGYDLVTLAARPDDCDLPADRLDDPRLAPLREAASAGEVVVLAGASVRRGGGRTISLLAVDDDLRVVYDKQHLCAEEAQLFVPGESGSMLSVDGWPLGLAICYDGCFPEHARAAADAGALAYVAAVAYAAGSEHRRDLYYRARAVENGMYAVVGGLVGRCGSGGFGGGSAVYDAEGRALDRVDDDAEGMAIATLDARAQRETRAAHPMHADHRPSLGPMLRH